MKRKESEESVDMQIVRLCIARDHEFRVKANGYSLSKEHGVGAIWWRDYETKLAALYALRDAERGRAA